MALTIDTALLGAAAKKYAKELLMMAIIGLEDSLKHMVVKNGITDSKTFSQITGEYELRPYDGEINAQSALTIKGRELKVYKGQIIAEEDPEQFRNSAWTDLLAGKNAAAPAKMPIEKEILIMFINSASQGLNKKLFNAVRDDHGTTTADLFNGFDTITAAEIADNKLTSGLNNYEVIGAIDSSNAVDQLKSAWQSLEPSLRRQKIKMYISDDILFAYEADYQNEFGTSPFNQNYEQKFLVGSSNMCELVPLVGKADSDYIHVTVPQNMMVGVDQMSDYEKVLVREISNPNKAQFVLNMIFGTQFNTLNKEMLKVFNVASGS